jgi:hypothetical protein
MKTCFSDPTLGDVLADPLVRTIMAADRVDAQKLETMLGRIARTIAGRSAKARSATAMACCA